VPRVTNGVATHGVKHAAMVENFSILSWTASLRERPSDNSNYASSSTSFPAKRVSPVCVHDA